MAGISRLTVTCGDAVDPPLPTWLWSSLLSTMERLNWETLKPWRSCQPCFKVTHFSVRGGFQKQREPITRKSGEIGEMLRF